MTFYITFDHTLADTEGGGMGSRPPWKITTGYSFPSKFWYGTPLEKQVDPLGPVASLGRSVQPSVKYDED